MKALDNYIEYYNNKRIKARLNGERVRYNTELFPFNRDNV
ncbi:IS3 family transposase [uncultured Coprobacter sp.]